MRLYQSIKNAFSGLLLQIFTILFGLATQFFFIRYLGIQYVGISGVFNNVISMLGIAELGIGTAMVYALYKPLAEKDEQTTASLMLLYKRAYQWIGIIVFIIGLLMLPFVRYVFKDLSVDVNLYLVFVLYLFNTAFSYFYSYKRSILYADQNDYINKCADLITVIVTNIIQIVTLIVFSNFYIFLVIRFSLMMLENVVVSLFVNHRYPFLLNENVNILPSNEKHKIISNVKALICHKIGGFIVLGTDSIIVSALINVTTAGIYGNYQFVVLKITSLQSTIIESVTASMGNLFVLEPQRAYSVFLKIYYMNFFITTVTGCCLFNCLHPFICFYAGEDNVLSFYTEVVIVVGYYVSSMRASVNVGKNAGGIYRPDRFVPLWEAFVNIVASLALVKYIGVAGVIIGTIISTLCSVYISGPYLTYQRIYHKKLCLYYLYYLYYFSVACICCFISFYVCQLFSTPSYLVQFFQNGILSIVGSCIVLFTMTWKRPERIYFMELIKKSYLKKFKRERS